MKYAVPRPIDPFNSDTMNQWLKEGGSKVIEEYSTDYAKANKIVPLIKEWQNRPLKPVYAVVFLDAVHFK